MNPAHYTEQLRAMQALDQVRKLRSHLDEVLGSDQPLSESGRAEVAAQYRALAEAHALLEQLALSDHTRATHVVGAIEADNARLLHLLEPAVLAWLTESPNRAVARTS